jgi:uncharacterized protein (TIGR02145 family)
LPKDTAVYGKINTNFVYVKENGSWRRGTELDASLDAACVADNKGMTDSLIVEREPVWYICDVNDDASALQSIPTAWRKATTAEADTAGFGAPDGEVARTGNKDESHIYVHEDTSGNGDYAWRRGTNLDIVSDLGPCTKNLLNKVAELPITETSSAWYTCAVNKIIYENGVQLPYAWREATDIEKDTVGWGKGVITGQIKFGKENTNLVYVFENGTWRHGTDMDRLLGVACTESKAVSRDTSKASYKNEYYVCTPQSTPDTLRKWVVASDIYNDTHDALDSCKNKIKYADGAIMVGRLHTERMYVCDNGEFRPAKSDEISYNRACVESMDGQIYKVNGAFRRCSDSKWIAAKDGDSSIVKDADGRVYKTIIIGTQHWMAQNLNYAMDESYCYDNILSNCTVYGRLYTLAAAENACPIGWHIPTLSEWSTLINLAKEGTYSNNKPGYKLKSKTGWDDYSYFGDQEDDRDGFGFSALPAGSMHNSGTFGYKGQSTCFWGKTLNYGSAYAYLACVRSNSDNASMETQLINYAYSVRCIQD